MLSPHILTMFRVLPQVPLSPRERRVISVLTVGAGTARVLGALAISHPCSLLSSGVERPHRKSLLGPSVFNYYFVCFPSQGPSLCLSQASCVPYTFKGPKALGRPSSCVWPVGSSSKPTGVPGPRFRLVKACQSLVAFWNRCRSHQNPTSFNFFSYLLVVL